MRLQEAQLGFSFSPAPSPSRASAPLHAKADAGSSYRMRRDAGMARAHRADPVTSHAAAAQVEASGVAGRQRAAVLELVRRWPGLTSIELAGRSQDLDRWQLARRLPELAPDFARQGPPKLFGGRSHVTWWPVKA